MLTSFTLADEKTNKMIQNGLPPSNFTSFQTFIKVRHGEKATDLSKEVSCQQVYQIWAEQPIQHSARATNKAARNVCGQPSKLDARTKRLILRKVKLFQQTEPNWIIKRLTESGGISGTGISKQGERVLLSNEDKQGWVNFARVVLLNYNHSLSTAF